MPNYIKYNPGIFAQINNLSSTGLVLDTYANKISLALGNNSSNTSNIYFLTSENNSFKIQYNGNYDIIKYTYENSNVNAVLYGNQKANKYYVNEFNDTSIILNNNQNQNAGFGFNEANKSLNYITTIDGSHTFKANSGSLQTDIATLSYKNNIPQLIINPTNSVPASSIYSLNVNGSANITGNLNINGSITGKFPTGVVQLNSNNKIDVGLLPQLAPDFRVLKTGKNIGIGTKNPISKLHIYNGDILLQNGWIGINMNSNLINPYPPMYPMHINYEINTLPALALTSNNIVNFIAYADHPAIGIGTNKIDSPNTAIYANGDIQCRKIFSSGLNVNISNINVLYYNTTQALVSESPLILNNILYASVIKSSIGANTINFSNCGIITDDDIVVKNNSITKLFNQYYSGQYVGFGVSNNINYKIHVLSSNANTIAGFGSHSNDGALISLYTSNNISSNFTIGINNQNKFIIRDYINNDINGIKYSSDVLNVDNIITSNITILSTLGQSLNFSNILNNCPFNNINEFNINKFVSSNIIKIKNNTSDSALEILGKTRIYNDSDIIPVQVECGNNFVSFLTNTNIPYKYVNTNTINPLTLFTSGVNFQSSNAITKLLFNGTTNAYIANDKVYLDYNGLFLSNIIFNNPLRNVLDIAFDDNTIYYINKNDNKVYYAGYTTNINTSVVTCNINYSLLINDNKIYTKIRAGNNFAVVLDNSNNLYSFGANNLSQLGRIITPSYYNFNIINIITGLPINNKIIDISCGYSHTGILYEDGSVWTFGDNTAYKRGYDNLLSTNLILPYKITAITEKIIKIVFRYDNSIFLSEYGNVYISGNITNKLNLLTNTPYMLTNIPKMIDISCGKNNVALLTYYNEIFTFNNLDLVGDFTNIGRYNSSGSQYFPKQTILPYNFYGTSLYSHGSIVIGNNYFNIPAPQLAKNSLLIEGKLGIGTSVILPSIYTSNEYSMVLVGDMNIISGDIYKNGILYTGGGPTSSSSVWQITEDSIYYKGLNAATCVGIGTTNPSRTLSIDGDIGLTGNIYINDKLLMNEDLIWGSYNSNIYFNQVGGKIGINTSTPKNSFDIYDVAVSIRNIINSSNIKSVDNLILSLDISGLPPSTNDIGNNIEISGNGNTIAASIYKVYSENYSSNNVYIYKKSNDNIWNKTIIISPPKENILFGNSLKLSQDGSKLIIGCYNDYILNGITKGYNGALYICNINNFSSNIIFSANNSNIVPIYGPANKYIGEELAISYDASVIVTSANQDNTVLYVYQNTSNNNNIYTSNNIDYTNLPYHYSFGNSQTISGDGSIIVTTFIPNPNNAFIFNNIYIIKKLNGSWSSPMFLTKNINNNNYEINNVSISNDGKILAMAITDTTLNKINREVIYIYKLINNYLYNNIYTILVPHYIITLSSSNIFHAKISSDGSSILLVPYKIIDGNSTSYHYRYDTTNDVWIKTSMPQTINNVYTIKGSITDDGFNSVLALGNSIIVNDRATTNLISYINLYENYKEKTTFYSDKTGNISIGSNNTISGYDLNVNGTIGAQMIITDSIKTTNISAISLYGDGKNINNININNINGSISNIAHGGIFIGSNNVISQSPSNLSWDFNSNTLKITGTLISDAIYSSDGYNIKNIKLETVNSNTILSVSNGGIGTSNLISESLLIGNNKGVYQSSNLSFNSNTLYVKGTIIANNYIGDGFNISNLNIYNINNGTINVINGGTGVNKLNSNQIIIGNNSNIYQTSNLYWDIFNNRLGINNQLPSSEIDVTGTITASFFVGNGKKISNMVASNITGAVAVINGGTGHDILPYGQLLIGNDKNNIIITSNLIWSNITNTLNIKGLINADIINGRIIGDGSNLSNINAQNLIGKVSMANGGIGDLSNIIGGILFGGSSDNILSTSNFIWNSNTNCLGINTYTPKAELDVNGTIIAKYYNGDASRLSNIVATNIIGTLPSINGGTGCNILLTGAILIGNNTNPIIISSNLIWNNTSNLLSINGSIYANKVQGSIVGDGYNLSNINGSNITNTVLVSSGGTGYNKIDYGNILVGNNDNKLITSSNLVWSNLNNLLQINGGVHANTIQGYFIGDGRGISNVILNNVSGAVTVVNGGIGCNIIPYGNIIVGNNENSVITTTNLLWINSNNILSVNGTIYGNNIQGSFIGNGINISNILYSNISGEIQSINGGTGCNNIPYGNILIGNNQNPIITTSNLLWNNNSNSLTIIGSLNANTIYSTYIGDGKNISNIIGSNIIDTVSVANGGTGCNILPYGNILIGNDANPVIITSNLLWNNNTNILTVDGFICANTFKGAYIGDGKNISNIIASNIIDTVAVINGGTGYSNISYGSLLVGNNTNKLITTPNLIWSNINNSLIIDGSIYANTLQGSYIGNGTNISNIMASNIIGPVSVLNGGSGCNLLNINQILIGNEREAIYQTSNFVWNKNTNMLGINTSLPNYCVDVNGDINFNGNLLKNGALYISPSGFSNIVPQNSIMTQSNLIIGYTTIDNNYMLKVNGKIYSSDDITSFSDEKYKTNIITIDNALNKVNKLRGVYFNRTDIINSKRYTGVIAQEINKILPEVVSDSEHSGLSVAYGNIIGVLIESIKELTKRIETLENRP